MVVEANLTTDSQLAELRFQHPLRRYQQEILELVNIKLERGESQLHIVAPPGAGKTIIGLQIISQLRRPALIVCPNTTIQAQWEQKLELFVPPELCAAEIQNLIGTHEDKPLKPITILTYQVLSTPGREQEYLEKLAHQSWVEELTSGLSLSAGESELRILELMQNNPKAHQKELSRHSSRLRRKLTDILDLHDVLHDNALELLQALRRQKFGLVLFDECHHLTDYWAAVMIHLVKRLQDPIIIGLTGTPPEGKSSTQETRYLSLVGDIDYQVPTPALVKEGGLSPYQDLVFFTTPTEKEMNFLEGQHEDFHQLLQELTGLNAGDVTDPPGVGSNELLVAESGPPQWTQTPGSAGSLPASGRGQSLAPMIPGSADIAGSAGILPTADGTAAHPEYPPLTEWILRRAACRESWKAYLENEPELALAIGRYIWKNRLPVPEQIELTEALCQSPLIDDWMLLIEDFALHRLKTSSSQDDHRVYEKIKSAIRKLGYGLTERGLRRQASPVDRVLAYSEGKMSAAGKILETEYSSLQDRLRAVVVTDFERSAPHIVRPLQNVLGTEAGGAVAVLRHLLSSTAGQFINPCLVTGSLLLVDKRIGQQFLEAAQAYVREEGFEFLLVLREEPEDPYCEITAGNTNWETRLYVGMATELFERGITKCLVGTRGIFGEGWDSQSLNTLVDLTTASSPVSVKQLRGRSIRLHAGDPMSARKVANNWDVVSIAPNLEKGLNDYQRFVRKHEGYFGISDDGQIECGAGHVHPALLDLTPDEVFLSSDSFNQEMLSRALVRDKIYELWKVGQPYQNQSLGCVEVAGLRKLALTPPHIKRDMKYKEHARQLRSALNGIWWEYGGLGFAASAVSFFILPTLALSNLLAVLPLILSVALAARKHSDLYSRLRTDICQPNTQESSLADIGLAILSCLQVLKLLPRHITRDSLKITIRANNTYRVFLDDVEPEHSQYFARCFKEAMAPIANQPFLIPKYEYSLPRGKEEMKSEKAFFRAYLRGKAEPRIAAYHALPKLIARNEKGREAFQAAWNKYVSPGFVVSTETKPELLEKYFGMGPSLAQRLLWE